MSGAEVYHRSFGTGPRQVLAVHCSLAHSGAWRGLAAEMDAEITLTGFDLLSHGRSPDWDGGGNYQSLNVAAGLELLREPVDLLGHSFGATVALRMAAARPELVKSLTLIEPVLFAVARVDQPEMLAAMEEESGPIDAAWEAGDVELATRLFNRMWGPGEPRWPYLPEQLRAAMMRAMPVIPASYRTLYHDDTGTLEPETLARVTMPALVVAGDVSPKVMPEIARGLARRLPEARAEIVAGAGHMLPVTHPGEGARLLRELWGQG
ncbi:alpha/beta fold hydrolase [Cribrihabitans pelagius]|uniref:alpha/beta fold hydrolase n=1 Tax=Cribrihabitans pelagius TaxID=1765746 RepID=UPI003B5AA7B8